MKNLYAILQMMARPGLGHLKVWEHPAKMF